MSSEATGQYIKTSDQTWELFIDLIHCPDIVIQLLFLLVLFRNDARHICMQQNLINWGGVYAEILL